MKPSKKARRTDAGPAKAEPAGGRGNLPLWAAAAALAVALIVYLPALNGPFVFDDLTLPVLQEDNQATYTGAFGGVRPLYYISLLAQYKWHGLEPFPFHFANWLLHVVNALLLFSILRGYTRLGGFPAPHDLIAAAFGAGVFLLHPLNTEAVSYIASRSEVLSVLFAFLSWRLFLHARQPRLSWLAAAGVLVLLALGLAVKEHVIALIAVFFLTDLLFGGVRANLRFYVPLGVFGAGAAALLLTRAGNVTAGLGVEGATPFTYLVTQGAVIWRYLQLTVAPFGQSVDHAVPIAAGVFGFAGLAALLAVAVFLWRKGHRLAFFGWVCFLLCLAPTSSLVPIADAMVERRMYLAMPGLALLAAPWIRNVKPWMLAVILVILAGFTWQRNEKWASTEALWRDALAGNPGNARAHFQLGYALYLDGRCGEAAGHYALADKHGGPELGLNQNWALALDCDARPDEALAILERESEMSHLRWATAGMIEGKRGRVPEALAALDRAIAISPGFAMSWVYRGNVLENAGRREEALAAYRRALEFEPGNQAARQALAAAKAR
jgi:protein O-mannosyl-transferase